MIKLTDFFVGLSIVGCLSIILGILLLFIKYFDAYPVVIVTTFVFILAYLFGYQFRLHEENTK